MVLWHGRAEEGARAELVHERGPLASGRRSRRASAITPTDQSARECPAGWNITRTVTTAVEEGVRGAPVGKPPGSPTPGRRGSDGNCSERSPYNPPPS